MTDVNIYSLATVFFLQCLGAYEHWRVMKKANRVGGTFWNYLTDDRPRNSAVTYILLGLSAWGACVSGIAVNINPSVVWTMLTHGQLNAAFIATLITSITTGYGFDSRFNKGTSPDTATV